MYLFFKESLHFSDIEIDNLTQLKVGLILQRKAEPVYQKEINDLIRKQKEKNG